MKNKIATKNPNFEKFSDYCSFKFIPNNSLGLIRAVNSLNNISLKFTYNGLECSKKTGYFSVQTLTDLNRVLGYDISNLKTRKIGRITLVDIYHLDGSGTELFTSLHKIKTTYLNRFSLIRKESSDSAPSKRYQWIDSDPIKRIEKNKRKTIENKSKILNNFTSKFDSKSDLQNSKIAQVNISISVIESDTNKKRDQNDFYKNKQQNIYNPILHSSYKSNDDESVIITKVLPPTIPKIPPITIPPIPLPTTPPTTTLPLQTISDLELNIFNLLKEKECNNSVDDNDDGDEQLAINFVKQITKHEPNLPPPNANPLSLHNIIGIDNNYEKHKSLQQSNSFVYSNDDDVILIAETESLTEPISEIPTLLNKQIYEETFIKLYRQIQTVYEDSNENLKIANTYSNGWFLFCKDTFIPWFVCNGVFCSESIEMKRIEVRNLDIQNRLNHQISNQFFSNNDYMKWLAESNNGQNMDNPIISLPTTTNNLQYIQHNDQLIKDFELITRENGGKLFGWPWLVYSDSLFAQTTVNSIISYRSTNHDFPMHSESFHTINPPRLNLQFVRIENKIFTQIMTSIGPRPSIPITSIFPKNTNNIQMQEEMQINHFINLKKNTSQNMLFGGGHSQ